MTVLSAEVVDGRLELPEGAAKEGETLMVLVPDGEENGFRLSPEEQAGIDHRVPDRSNDAATQDDLRRQYHA